MDAATDNPQLAYATPMTNAQAAQHAPRSPWITTSLRLSVAFVACMIGSALSELLVVAAAMCAIGAVVAAVVGNVKHRHAPRARASLFIAFSVASVIGAIAGVNWRTTGAIDRANRVKCGMNLRQIHTAATMYAFDNPAGRYPPTIGAFLAFADGVTPWTLICPGGPEDIAVDRNDLSGPGTAKAADAAPEQHCSYVYLGGALARSSPADAVVAYERHASNHRGRGVHVLFNDGTVEFIDAKTAAYVAAEAKAGFNPPRQKVRRP